ncbi:hypothetical protein BV20DRAFT_973652 [Pilatotrama ljubarskyi]|nr:hypothetical protein BV20DRAFT_973652 [Pilatotrama ljubarskyi]
MFLCDRASLHAALYRGCIRATGCGVSLEPVLLSLHRPTLSHGIDSTDDLKTPQEMSDSAYDPEVVAEYSEILFENYCLVVSCCLLWYDVVITFPREVDLIWKRKFNAGTYVYLTTRYTAVVERVFFMLKVMVTNSSDQVAHTDPVCASCSGMSHTDDVLTILNYVCASGASCRASIRPRGATIPPRGPSRFHNFGHIRHLGQGLEASSPPGAPQLDAACF